MFHVTILGVLVDGLITQGVLNDKKVENPCYRPIRSLTSVYCKTLERIVVDGLTEYLNSDGILSTDQFGFRSGRSTEDQLLLTYNSITS